MASEKGIDFGGTQMMTDRFLNRKNLLTLGFFTLLIHLLATLLPYFGNADWPYVVDYVFIGLTAFAGILYFAKAQIPVRFEPAQMLLIFFMLWYIFSCLSMTITYGSDWVSYNRQGLFFTGYAMLMVFPLGYAAAREEKNQTGVILLHALLLGWTLFMLFILVNAFQGRNIPLSNGGSIYMKSGALWMNTHRNTTGAWEMIFFMGCSFMLFRCRKVWMKVIYGLATLIHYVGLTFSNSRASIIAAMIGFAALIGIVLYLRLEKKNVRHRLLISIAVGLAAGALFHFLRPLVYSAYSAAIGTKESGRVIINTQDTTFSGRTRIWKWAIEGIFTSFRMFMFGVTPPSIPEMLSQVSQKTFTETYTHNQFIEIAAGIGVPGLILFLGWLVILLRDTWKLVFVRKDRTLMLAVPVMILVLLMANMMEAYLVFYNYMGGYFFFLLSGILHGYVNPPAGDKYSLNRILHRNAAIRGKRK